MSSQSPLTICLWALFAVVALAAHIAETFRDHSRKQIDGETAKVRRGVMVLSDMLYSSPELQDQFHAWMAEIPAVRWYPRLVLGLELVLPFWFPISRDECGWIHALAFCPGTLLMGAHVAVDAKGWPKQAQSLYSLLSMAYLLIMVNTLVATKDKCIISIGPDGTSLAAAVAYSACLIIADHALTPCSMQHVPVLCWVIGIGNCTLTYMQYLQQNAGLTSKEFDPFFLRLLAVGVSSVISSLAVYCIRVYLSKDIMIGFLRSLPHQD